MTDPTQTSFITNPALIIRFIETHGHRTRPCARPGFVEAEVTYGDGSTEWESVQLTVTAARNWLGY
ncbi:MAG: hypothetical protein ACRYGG_19735 [Janthinobacterium lividum]